MNLIIDVSEHNGTLDWDVIKGQINGAILRCGYGGNAVSQDDKQYARNLSECIRLNIPYGVYIYSYARNVAEAEDEANHVLRLVKGYHVPLPIYYDVEYSAYQGDLSAQQFSAQALAFCKKIEEAGGFVGIYANTSYWQTKLTDPGLDAYTRWVAQWASSVTLNKPYQLWQYSSDGVISGSSARTDVNRYYGDFMSMVGEFNDFRSNVIPTPTPTPEPTPDVAHKLGETVSFNALYTASTSTNKITNIAITSGVITKIIATAPNPYLINNGTGWVNDSVIISANTPSPVPTTFQIGDLVRVKKGASDYNGTSLAPFVYQTVYKVMQVNGNRVVIGSGSAITAAMRSTDLMKA